MTEVRAEIAARRSPRRIPEIMFMPIAKAMCPAAPKAASGRIVPATDGKIDPLPAAMCSVISRRVIAAPSVHRTTNTQERAGAIPVGAACGVEGDEAEAAGGNR